MSRLIFADTSAIVAKLLEGERHHAAAKRALRDLLQDGRRFLTTDYVFDEMVTRVRSLAGHAASIEAGSYVLESAVIEVLEVDRGLRDSAWGKYKRYREHALSFTDCVSFAVMDKYKIKDAFTFDLDFVKVGYVALPPTPRR
jgi:predicted nucleic acid-binding protein